MGCLDDKCATVVGTEIKFAITLDLPAPLTMEKVDFTATFYCLRDRLEIKKEEMIRQDDGSYIAIVDTSKIGAGEVKCDIEAQLPDSQCADGFRTERIRLTTGEVVRGGLH